MTKRNHLMKIGFLTGIISCVTTQVFAGDTIEPTTKNNKSSDATIRSEAWEVTGAAGAGLADGNAESLSYSLQLLASRITLIDEIYLGSDYFYADDKGAETKNALRLNVQYNRLINDRLYYGVAGSYLNDQVADLDYRIDVNALIGYYLLKNDRASLALEAGPGYAFEKQGGIKDDYTTLRLGEKFEYKITDSSKLWQSITFTPEVGDFNNYLLTGEVGIDTAISDKWALRTFVRHQIDNTPAIGRGEDDTSVMVGLAYSLSGFPEPAKAGRKTLKPAKTAAAATTMGWSSTGSLGFNLTSGNSDTIGLNAGYETAYRSTENEFFFNAATNLAENNNQTSLDNTRANIQYNRLFTDRFFGGVSTGFLRDDIAAVNYRFTPAVVAGYYLIKQNVTTLSVEAGPGYTLEKVAGVKDDFLAIQAAEKFTTKIGSRSTFNQDAIYNAEASHVNNFTLTCSAYIDTDITTNLALRVATTYVYDNKPAVGLERHDTTLTTGIAVKF
jgi:putative salt-induced outer membrane protein YdiY